MQRINQSLSQSFRPNEEGQETIWPVMLGLLVAVRRCGVAHSLPEP